MPIGTRMRPKANMAGRIRKVRMPRYGPPWCPIDSTKYSVMIRTALTSATAEPAKLIQLRVMEAKKCLDMGPPGYAKADAADEAAAAPEDATAAPRSGE